MKDVAILWDLDGTLLDTLEDLKDAANYALRQFGCPERTLEEVRRFVGNGAGLLIRRALPGKDTDASYGTPDSPDDTAAAEMPDNVADLGRSSQFSDAEDVSTGASADTGAVLDNASGAVLDSASGPASTDNTYIPGIYTTELILGSETANVEVIVNDHAITSVSLADPSETLTTMYPLLEPTMESLNDQLCEMQDPSQVTYSAETRYTSLVLLEAVKASLEKAKPKATPEATGAPDATNAPKADINPAA